MSQRAERWTAIEQGLRSSWATLRAYEALLAMNHEIATEVRPRLASTYEERVSFWELRVEAHVLLIYAQNLDRAVRALRDLDADVPRQQRRTRHHIRILRNSFEHWDDRTGESWQKLVELVGRERANQYGFSHEEVYIGGLALGPVAEYTRDVHARLVALEDSGWPSDR